MIIERGEQTVLEVSFGSSYSGLNTVGYELKNPGGSTYSPRTTTGVVSEGAGYYHVVRTFPEVWIGYIEWTTAPASLIVAREDIEVIEFSIPFVPPTPPQYNADNSSFNRLVERKASTSLFHRDYSSIPCPCRTPEGYRDPAWHEGHLDFPVCNMGGFLHATNDEIVNISIKAFIQPLLGQGRRIAQTVGQTEEMLGNIEVSDHYGIFPVVWHGKLLNFDNWSRTGDEYIEYIGTYFTRRFIVIGATLVPDPITGAMGHHWECLMKIQGQD